MHASWGPCGNSLCPLTPQSYSVSNCSLFLLLVLRKIEVLVDQTGLWPYLWEVVLIEDSYKIAQTTLGNAVSALVDMGNVRKLADHKSMNKAVSLVPLIPL